MLFRSVNEIFLKNRRRDYVMMDMDKPNTLEFIRHSAVKHMRPKMAMDMLGHENVHSVLWKQSRKISLAYDNVAFDKRHRWKGI